jgi:hypothetical protein
MKASKGIHGLLPRLDKLKNTILANLNFQSQLNQRNDMKRINPVLQIYPISKPGKEKLKNFTLKIGLD